MQRKRRILFCTEFTKLNTGYSNYYAQLMASLHKTGKYDLFELASYAMGSNPLHQKLISEIPWKVIPNMPEGEYEENIYNSSPVNEFGKFKFEHACLETQPDIVVSIKDAWMDSYLEESIYRRLYKLVLMPTLDGTPLHPEWLSLYLSCDHILTYTDWSKELIEEESGGLVKVEGVPSPTADASLFQPPANKKELKQKLGLSPDSFIVGFVGRNQRRKLYPDLAKSFVEFLEKVNLKDTKDTYLYFHCAYPDLGFDIPQIIKANGLAHKVYMTYFCQNCHQWFPHFYQDAVTLCKFCGVKSATLANSQMGIDRQALASIYGVIDLYVQHTLTEGFGLPHMEAAFCGCITCGTDYGGTIDILKKTNSKAIPVKRFYLEAETGRHMALPDNAALAEYIDEVHSLPESVRSSTSRKTASLARKNFGTWDDVAEKWMKVFDSVEIPQQNMWAAAPDIVNTNGIQTPQSDRMSDEQFVGWSLGEVLHRPEWVNSYRGLKLLRDLSWNRVVVNNLGFFANEASALGGKPTYEPFDRTKLMQFVIAQRNAFNMSEQARWQYMQSGRIQP